ncbi:MAG: hypothetical protein ACRDHW_08120 [Ktedonobacteraceae bacterium]
MPKVRKMKRGYYITDEAFLSFQAMAEEEGQSPGPFFERVIRDLAAQKLTDEKRAAIRREAEHLAESAPATD